jgi:hypothetical protein
MASDKPAMPERGLESRIRAPTESPPEALRNSRRGSGQRLDAAALRAASTAAAEGRRQWSGGRFTSSNQPGKGKVNTSPRELEESVRAMNESLMSCDMPSTPTAATAATAATALGRPGGINGRPGQVYNAVTKRWEYVEEVDSDDD